MPQHATPWALASNSQLLNQITMQTNEIANLRTGIANLRTEVVICFNMTSAIIDQAAIRQPIVAGFQLTFPFPQTRGAFLYYDLNPIPGEELAHVKMKRSVVAHHIGLRL